MRAVGPTMAELAWLLSVSLKVAVLLAMAWLGAGLLRRGTAAARHQVWTLGVAGALLLPVLCWGLPSLLSVGPSVIDGERSLVAPAVLVTGGDATIGAGRAAPAAPMWPVWVAGVWAAGAVLVSSWFLRGHLAARRLARAARPARVEAWSLALGEAAAALAITRAVELGRSEAIGSPMTVGVLRPRVLLPAAADGWSRERLRAVLMHELGHVRRHDPLIQVGAQLACALYWWNPIAWLAAARLRREREHACDDLVLGAGVRASSYAADLLAVARAMSSDAGAHAGAVYMVEPSWTEARLRRILDGAAPRRPLRVGFRLAAAGVAAGCAVMLACTSTPLAPATATATTAGAMDAKAAGSGPALLGTASVGAPFYDLDRVPPRYRPQAEKAADAYDLSLVAAEVQRHVGDLQQCYQERLRTQPLLAGTVIIHWVVTAGGKVADQCITEDTVQDAAIRDCVNSLVAAGQYPEPRGGDVDVSFPFVFTPPASPVARALSMLER